MSCAGCDDCTDGHWHLHVTVGCLKNEFWSKNEEYELVRTLGYKFVRVTNVMLDTSYDELIPTLHFQGNESAATKKLIEMVVVLDGAGFQINRAKIEGDPKIVPHGRALYYEAHVKNVGPVGERHAKRHLDHFHLSINSRGENIWTMRDKELGRVLNLHYAIVGPGREPRVEACVLDTAPELDAAWLAGARAPELR